MENKDMIKIGFFIASILLVVFMVGCSNVVVSHVNETINETNQTINQTINVSNESENNGGVDIETSNINVSNVSVSYDMSNISVHAGDIQTVTLGDLELRERSVSKENGKVYVYGVIKNNGVHTEDVMVVVYLFYKSEPLCSASYIVENIRAGKEKEFKYNFDFDKYFNGFLFKFEEV